MLLRTLAETYRPRKPRKTAGVDLRWQGATAHVSVGKHAFTLRSDHIRRPDEDAADFALFGAAAIALAHNLELRSDLPFSDAALDGVRQASDIIDCWHTRRCYPIALPKAAGRAPAPPQSRAPGLLCLSGGVDSTYAALEAGSGGQASHGMLIAGADYPDAAHPGFVDLRARVAAIGAETGLETFVVETTIRQAKLYWPIAHVFVLAMCLSFHQRRFAQGLIAADFTLGQQFGYHPWGNCDPLVGALSMPQFPIRQVGAALGRSAKIGAIARARPQLMDHISVCHTAKHTGGNCGVCEKCIRTKLNLVAAGIDPKPYFEANPDLVRLIADLNAPKAQADRRRQLVFLQDACRPMPGGPVRDALVSRIERLQTRTARTGKI